MAKYDDSWEWIKIIIGLLIGIPIMVGVAWAFVGDFLKALFIDNFGNTVSTIFIIALIFIGLYIVGQVFGSLSGSKSKPYSRISGAYPENWGEIRSEVLKRDGHRCGNCGSTTNLHVHHIVPISKGGTNNLSNLRTLCRDCHKKLHPHMQ